MKYRPTVFLSIALMAIMIMMIIPVPSWVLDVGLAASFGLAILVFTTTLFVERPLDFSAFPSILLFSLMLRLSLNISSTKLIIGEGHNGIHVAGSVIQGFAMFVMGGSMFLGAVIFGVLLIVNFVVITKGATRMAEVGARFALDGMPGKQMAIDSDVASGSIGHDEASQRREIEQAETTFFGSLDGASKFVKGDAVAGLLITLLNMVAGVSFGIVAHNMPASKAFETYAILTVGDGLVSQIPSVIISIASAMLLSRGGIKGSTELAIFSQIGRKPTALVIVGSVMAFFALLPGLPLIPFAAAASILIGIALFAKRADEKQQATVSEADDAVVPPPAQSKIGDVLDLDDIHVEFAADLVEMIVDPATGLDARIANMRNHVAEKFGIVLSEIRITDNAALPGGTYVIKIHGVEQARDVLRPSQFLVLVSDQAAILPDGVDVSEPVYGAPARWISSNDRQEAALMGSTIVSPTEVLATHLLEVIKKNLHRLLTLKALRNLLKVVGDTSDSTRSQENKQLIDDLVPDKIPMELLLSVLRLLLEDRISIRNLPLILEAILEAKGTMGTSDAICEHVRHRLAFQIIADLQRPDGTLPLLQLAPAWEERFVAHQLDGPPGQASVALPPEEFAKLTREISTELSRHSQDGVSPALVTSTLRRRFISTILASKGILAPVLSYDEIGNDVKPAMVGLISA